jgi:hypothetical protein
LPTATTGVPSTTNALLPAAAAALLSTAAGLSA